MKWHSIMGIIKWKWWEQFFSIITWYSVRLLLLEKKNLIKTSLSSLKMCFHLHCPVNILHDKVTPVTLEAALLWTDLQNQKRQPLDGCGIWSDFFLCATNWCSTKISQMLVLWRWALSTNSACCTTDRTHHTCDCTSADESRRKCVLLKWKLLLNS